MWGDRAIGHPLSPSVAGGNDGNGPPDLPAEGGTAAGTLTSLARAALPDILLGGMAPPRREAEEAEEGSGGGHTHEAFLADLRLPKRSSSTWVAAPGAGFAVAGEGSGGGGGGLGGALLALPEGVRVVASSVPGQSCDDVCAGATLLPAADASSSQQQQQQAAAARPRCVAYLLRHINSCAALQAAFPCARCADSAGPDQPALIDTTAPADKQPGACLVNNAPQLFACEGRWEFARRLCPCQVPP